MEQPTLRADARANRLRLIEAAHEVFRDCGLDAEMKEIADRAGVGVGTLYRNFPTKEDLVEAMAGEMIQQMRENLDQALCLDDPIEAIRALLRGALSMLERYGDMMSVFHSKLRQDRVNEFKHWGEILEKMTALVRKGMTAGVFRADLDAELVAMRIMTSFHPGIIAVLRQTRSLDEIVDAHVDLLLHGIQKQEE